VTFSRVGVFVASCLWWSSVWP